MLLHPLFLNNFIVLVLIIFSLLQVDSEKGKSHSFFRDMTELFKRVDVDVFLFVIFLLGANWGFLENYLFVFLNSLKAPTYLLGK